MIKHKNYFRSALRKVSSKYIVQWNMEQQQQPGTRAGQNQSNFGRRMEEEDFEQIPLNPMFAANRANFSNRGGASSQQHFNRNNASKYDNW